jgi:hypothetical protein
MGYAAGEFLAWRVKNARRSSKEGRTIRVGIINEKDIFEVSF